MMRTPTHKRAARLAAVCIGSLLAAGAVVWAAPRVSQAVAAWASTPPVRVRSMSVPAALPVGAPSGSGSGLRAERSGPDEAAPGIGLPASVTVDAGMRFTMVGVICAPPARRGGVLVRLRTSEDAQHWSRWYEVALERAAETGGRERAFTEPVWTGAGRFVQVAARAAGGGAPPARLRDVRVVAVNSTEDADLTASVAGTLRRAVACVAGAGLLTDADAMTVKPQIVSRRDWGANESWRSGEPGYAPVRTAFVHHTASGNSYSRQQAPAVVRGVYAYHTRSLRWSDIGYNFLIDRYGTIYEGRYGGVDRGVIGAHVLGFNTGSTGISLIGTFSDASPPAGMVGALTRLLAWKLDVHHVDPQGRGTLVCGYGQKFRTGQRVTFPAIAGHRDANFTDCPGGRIYRQLPAVRTTVARTGHPKIYAFNAGPAAISPNGDGVRDDTSIRFEVSRAATWSVRVRDAAGEVVRARSGAGKSVAITWDGRGDHGAVLPDGQYEVCADATNADGVARAASAVVRIDTTPPRIKSASVVPDPFSPNDDGQDDRATLTFVPGEAGTARVSVVDAGGVVLRRLTGWASVAAAAVKVGWDGRIQGGAGLTPAPEGVAHLLIELRDRAGNPARLTRSVRLDRTLALAGVSRRTFSPNGDGVGDSVTLSFTLSRKVAVTVSAMRAGATLWSRGLGPLGRGSHSVVWAGVTSDGSTVTGGPCSLRVTADGPHGTTTVNQPLTVDLAAPRVTAPPVVTVKRPGSARVGLVVRDADSQTIKVTATVTDALGRTVTRSTLGWVKQGVSRTWTWRPKARGAYRVIFSARDRGGNQAPVPAVTRVEVR